MSDVALKTILPSGDFVVSDPIDWSQFDYLWTDFIYFEENWYEFLFRLLYDVVNSLSFFEYFIPNLDFFGHV